jgi:NIMA (never in mitosis gene a)-related kinase
LFAFNPTLVLYLTAFFADEFLKKLGEGGFGSVHIAKRKTDGKLFVVKKMKLVGGCLAPEQQQEIFRAKSLDCQYIMKVYDSFFKVSPQGKVEVHLVTEYCEGGDLGTVIEAFRLKKDLIPESVCRSCLPT